MATESETSSLETLINDANDNYINSRFFDAALSFKYIAGQCMRFGYNEDVLYFMYRSIVASARADDKVSLVSTIRTLGMECLKLSTIYASNFIEQAKTPKERAAIIHQAQQNLHNLYLL